MHELIINFIKRAPFITMNNKHVWLNWLAEWMFAQVISEKLVFTKFYNSIFCLLDDYISDLKKICKFVDILSEY